VLWTCWRCITNQWWVGGQESALCWAGCWGPWRRIVHAPDRMSFPFSAALQGHRGSQTDDQSWMCTLVYDIHTTHCFIINDKIMLLYNWSCVITGTHNATNTTPYSQIVSFTKGSQRTQQQRQTDRWCRQQFSLGGHSPRVCAPVGPAAKPQEGLAETVCRDSLQTLTAETIRHGNSAQFTPHSSPVCVTARGTTRHFVGA